MSLVSVGSWLRSLRPVADTATATPSASTTAGASSVASPDPAGALVGTFLVVVLAALLLRRFR